MFTNCHFVEKTFHFVLQKEVITDEMVKEFRASVLEQIDANKDGKVELGEFARFPSILRVLTNVIFMILELRQLN